MLRRRNWGRKPMKDRGKGIKNGSNSFRRPEVEEPRVFGRD